MNFLGTLTLLEMFGAVRSLEAALKAIPGPELQQFHATLGNSVGQTKTQHVLTILVQYKGSSLFAFYMTDEGVPFTSWAMRDYLTPPIQQATLDWFYAIQLQKMYRVAKARIALYKEELMAAAWHPRRVERLLADGGFEALDD